MDVAVAAESWSKHISRQNRFGLLDVYAKRRLRDAPAGTHASLATVAGILKTRISRSLLESEFERLTNSTGRHVLLTGLCEEEQGFVSFRHDYFLDYFAAEHVLQRGNLGEIAEVLEMPTFSDLALPILEAQSEGASVLELFSASRQARTLGAAALSGDIGPIAQDVCLQVVDQATRAITAELRTCPNVSSLQETPSQVQHAWLIECLGDAVRAPAPRAALGRLLTEVETVVNDMTGIGESGDPSSRWFAALAHPPSTHPVARALNGAHNVLQAIGGSFSRTPAEKELPSRTLGPLSLTLYSYLLLAEVRSSDSRDRPLTLPLQDEVIDLVGQAATSTHWHFFINAMFLAHDCAGRFASEKRSQMIRVLEDAKSKDVRDHALVLDALDAYGQVEPAYDPGELLEETKKVLGCPFDPVAQGRAQGLVSATTEPLSAVHGPHIEALSCLTSEEQVRLRGMAAMAACASERGWRSPDDIPTLACATDWHKEEIAIVALRTWATLVPDLQYDGSRSVLAFVYANEACARANVELNWKDDDSTVEGIVWKTLGTMVYGQARGAPVAAHWKYLGSVRLHALIPILWLVGVDEWYDWYSARKESVRFREVWRSDLANYLRELFLDPATIGVKGHVPQFRDSPAEAALSLMGEVGDPSDIEWIRRLTLGPCGASAVKAIKRLKREDDAGLR